MKALGNAIVEQCAYYVGKIVLATMPVNTRRALQSLVDDHAHAQA